MGGKWEKSALEKQENGFLGGIMRMLWVKRENREFFVPAGRETQGAADPKFFPEIFHADS